LKKSILKKRSTVLKPIKLRHWRAEPTRIGEINQKPVEINQKPVEINQKFTFV
jgi:hypothetical protein